MSHKHDHHKAIDSTRLFGRDPAKYDHARMDYDSRFVLSVLDSAIGGLGKLDEGAASTPLRIMDIGAGSGKLGNVFVKAGYPTTFVEPNPNFLQYLSQKYAGNPHVSIIGARAEKINVPDNSVDVVVMGDAAHWVSEESLSELRRILKPEGKMIVFARIFSQESAITHELHGLLSKHCKKDYRSSPSQLVRDFRNTRMRLGRHLVSDEDGQWRAFYAQHAYSQDEMVELLGSLSFSAKKVEKDEPAFRENVIRPLWDFAQKEGLLDGQDKLKLIYEIHALYGAPRTRALGESVRDKHAHR